MKAGLPKRITSDEYYRSAEGRTGKVTLKTTAPYDPPHGDSTVRRIPTPQKLLSIGQTKKLLLAALRLWELKNGYRQ
jgi:hypothetical protein